MRLLSLIPWLVCLAGCTSCFGPQKALNPSINFVAPRPQYVEQTEYYVRVRIVIEYITVVLEEGDTSSTIMLFGEHYDTIKKELQYAEDLYSVVGLKFHIVKTEFREYGDFNPELLEDAAKFPNHLTLYYRLPRLDESFEGLSGAPYEGLHPYGILLSYNRNEWTVAHEIGHYFGLLHTFMDDRCADTPAELTEPCTGEVNGTKNCRNIMNYCVHTPKFVTKDQLERMESFIRSRRFNVIINPPPTTPEFDMEQFYGAIEVTTPNPTPQELPF